MTAALWLACFLAGGGQASVSYRIAGAVVNAVTSQPVPGARVTLSPWGNAGQRIETLSGAGGSFTFAGLPSGRYALAGQRRGLLPAATTVTAGEGSTTDNIVLRLLPPGVIAGKVVDDAGEPVAQALVQLLSSKIVDGSRQASEESVKRTDDAGEYRFSALSPGSYYVVVSAVPWYTKFNQTLGEEAPASMTHAGYAARYYPNTGEPAAAEAMVLKAGQEAAANFTLLPVTAGAVFVHCEPQEELSKQYTLTAAGLGGNPVTIREGSATGDQFNLWGVPPGHYTLRVEATSGGHTWYGFTEFDAAGAETEIDVSLRAAASLSGTIVPDGAGLPARLTVRLRDENGNSVSLEMGEDGRFSAPAIRAGRYRVSLAGAEEYHLRQPDGDTLNIAAGAAVRLNLPVSKATGVVAGKVYRDGQPLSGALVVLHPAHRAVRTDSDGTYEFRGVPPGEYKLFAVEDGTDLEYANSTAIRPYLGGAKNVQVGAGRTADVRLDAGK